MENPESIDHIETVIETISLTTTRIKALQETMLLVNEQGGNVDQIEALATASARFAEEAGKQLDDLWLSLDRA